MSKTDTLRPRDVRDAYRLIGECRDLGGDPALWQPHMLAARRSGENAYAALRTGDRATSPSASATS